MINYAGMRALANEYRSTWSTIAESVRELTVRQCAAAGVASPSSPEPESGVPEDASATAWVPSVVACACERGMNAGADPPLDATVGFVACPASAMALGSPLSHSLGVPAAELLPALLARLR